jgi:molybdopterin converting factor subunit 1
MKIHLRLFAVARQAAGCDVIELELPEGANVGRLREALAQRVPEVAGVVERMMFAVDAEYAADETELRAGGDVACIPPVSGG